MPLPRWPLLILLTFEAAHCFAQSSFDCASPVAPQLANPVVLGNGSAGSVSTSALQAALDAGGPVRLNIGTSTLTVNAELRVTRGSSLDAAGATLSGGNQRRVLRVDNPGNLTYTFDLLNATIASGSTPGGSGAGLWKPTGGPWQAVSIRVFNSRFTNNHAITVAQDDGGGGIYAVGAAELTVVSTQFDGNTGANGGAIYSLGSRRINLYDSVLSGNSATGTGGNPGNGGNAGAIGVDGGDRFVNLCRVRLLNNQSNAYGAGLFTTVYDTTSFTRILDSTIQGNNSAGSTNAHTGGVYLQGGPFSIRGSTFRDNQAAGYGGLSIFDHQTATLIRASGDISNSTFAGNIARTGLGGAMNLQGSGGIVLQNLTVANNSALCDVCFVGGINNGNGLPITMRNTVLQNNTGGNAYNPWTIRYPVSGSNNIQWPQTRPVSNQQEGAVTPGAVFANAQLSGMGSNGGLTETMALPVASIAVDAGTAVGSLATDQRGMPRVGAVDVGAYELQPDLIFSSGFD
ncbi:choice-of-anchor Q domain-containing protein [Dokdonella sp.]|uniref:choice-of-anchor Q domain-containing protein n=1 Tax=Dokdonella sp. TaxID=2291710 RepID=UPI003C445C04